jgi:tyrosinase
MANGQIVRRPAVPPPVRIRRDINKLAASDPIVTLYRDAIGVMKGRPLRDPTSWRYQAAIHGYPTQVATTALRKGPGPPSPGIDGPDPAAIDADFPLPGDRDTFWRHCAHNCWFFLPWHRMYLHFFEKIIMKIVKEDLRGPSDWALPYWNYSVSETAALLPPACRNEFLDPAGTVRNHLFVRERTPNANLGQPFLDRRPDGTLNPAKPHTSLQCLRQAPFRDTFGGPALLFHDPGGTPGAVESAPHNAVHARLGGSGGFMSLFSTAPLDPMFWLHHCNIDRLWEVWVQRQKQLGNLNRNPKTGGLAAAGGWLDEPFSFHDENKTIVQMTSKEVMDTRVPPLSYEYDDTSDPFNGQPNLP